MKQQENKGFVQSSYILMTGFLISSIISSIGTVIIIRLITIEEYSLLNISYGIPAILIVFGELGLNYASTHFIAKSIKEKKYKEVRDIIRINLLIKSSIGLIFSILVVLYSTYIAVEIYRVSDNRLILLIQIGAIGVFARIMLEAMNSFYVGALNVKMVQIGTILQTSLRTILSIVFILLGYTFIGPMLGFVLAPLIVAIFYLIFLKKTFYKDKIEKEILNLHEFYKMIHYGYPLLFLSAAASIQLPLYVYLLTVSGYIIEVGFLNVALVSASMIGILTKSISLTIFPIFSKYDWDNENEREKQKLVDYFQFSIKFGTLLIVPVSIILIFLSRDLFPIIFGERYREASPFISGYFLIFLLVSFGSLSIPAFFNGQKDTKNVFYIQLIELISILLFSIVLMPLFGAIGLIYGIFLGTIISVLFGNILIRAKYGNVLFKDIKNIIGIFLVAVLVGFLTFYLYSFLDILIESQGFLISIIKVTFFFIFYMGIFLFLLGILSLITVEELDFFEKSFAKFPVISKIIIVLSKVEKKIIKLKIKK